MLVFSVYIPFLICRVRPVHSFFEKKSILENPSQIFTNLFFSCLLNKCSVQSHWLPLFVRRQCNTASVPQLATPHGHSTGPVAYPHGRHTPPAASSATANGLAPMSMPYCRGQPKKTEPDICHPNYSVGFTRLLHSMNCFATSPS